MQKFKITYEIGDKGNPDTICTRIIEAGDADLAVTSLMDETGPSGSPLSVYIMFRITKVERIDDIKRHGGAYDRGMADSYYRRLPNPHYFVGGTNTSEKITKADMTQAQIADYYAGYQKNEQIGDYKDWG